MALSLIVLAFIIGLLLAETRLSTRHERLLRQRGAVAPDGDVYRLLALTYPAAFVVMGIEGAVRQAAPAGVFASGLLLFVASKWLKYWAIRALGERWSFRVLILPGVPLVTGGPYRYIEHPNYVAVLGELAGTAMMMGAVVTGPIAFVAFGAVLWFRVRFETTELRRAYEDVRRSL